MVPSSVSQRWAKMVYTSSAGSDDHRNNQKYLLLDFIVLSVCQLASSEIDILSLMKSAT